MPKKKTPRELPAKGSWQELSAAVTKMSGEDALRLLRLEAKASAPRPYVMKRLYHRWRAVSAREDLALIVVGKLPGYLR